LDEGTFFQSISILDSFLELVTQQLELHQLKLVVMACLIIACKYELVEPPSLKELCKRSGTLPEDVTLVEGQILNFLGFEISGVTSKHFLDLFREVSSLSGFVSTFSAFLIELALYDRNYRVIAPSALAAAAVLVSERVHQRSCGFYEEKFRADRVPHDPQYLQDLGNSLYSFYLKNIDSDYAVIWKYSQEENQCVALQGAF